MKTLQTRIDVIREEFQDARPDVALLIDFMAQLIADQQARIRELEAVPTDAEIDAASEVINEADNEHIGGGYFGIRNPRETAKAALEAAAKVRGK